VQLELLQMRDGCNNSDILISLIWILSIGLFPILADEARAECMPNQNEIPVCLSGTAIAPDYSGAVIQETGQAGLRQVLPGDMVDNWTVDEIGARYVVLKHGTRTVRLELPRTAETIPQQVAETPPAGTVKQGSVKHARSLARGGE
jgi:hypothetical protein